MNGSFIQYWSVLFWLSLLSEIGSLSNDGNMESSQKQLNGNEK